METLRNYLDQMFEKYEQNDITLKTKADLERLMEDKYNELLSEGKSKNEAIGIVISEFGNTDELDLKIKDGIDEDDNKKLVSLNNFRNFEAAFESTKKTRALGISSFLFGVALFMLSIALREIGILKVSENMAVALGMILLFLLIIIGIILLLKTNTIINGVKTWDEKTQILLPREVKSAINDRIKTNKQLQSKNNIIAIPLLLIASILPAITAMVTEDRYSDDLSSALTLIAVSVLLFVVGIAVYLFTINSYSDYKTIINQTDSRYLINESKSEKIQGILWMLTVLIYLAVSLITNRWDKTWIIWPIAGLLSAIVAIIYSHEK